MMKIKSKAAAILCCIIICTLASCDYMQYIWYELMPAGDKSKLSAVNILLYKGTPAWQLAKAVLFEDTLEIRKQVLGKGIPADYEDPQYHNTLLSIAAYKDCRKSVQCLLNLGADPNHYNDSVRYIGANPVNMAAKSDSHISILEMLLKKGGSPNSCNKGVEGYPHSKENRNSALMNVVYFSHSLEKAKLLVSYGADINYSYKYYEGDDGATALDMAIFLGRFDIALYLLNQGAIYKTDSTNNNILHLLRTVVIPPDFRFRSDREKKREIIKFLHERGIDYYSYPIPDYVLEDIKKSYPKSWKEYIKEY